jgi:hypothetical protein
MVSGYGFLNSTQVSMSCLVVVVISLALVGVVGWFELPKTEDRTVAKAAKMIVSVDIVESEFGLIEDS